jgi:growth arrest-specific protein 8
MILEHAACHDPCLQIYQQKVKHLLYEQQNNITTLKADAELALKLQSDDFYKREAELHRDKRALKQELKEQVRAWMMLA